MKKFARLMFAVAGCIAMSFAVACLAADKSGDSVAGKEINSLFRSGGMDAAPSMIQDGFATMAPPFFGQGQGQGGQPQPPQPPQPAAQQPGWGQPQPPAQQPGVWGQPQQPAGAQALIGAWMTQTDGQMILMIFMENGICGIGFNNQQLSGSYTVQGSHLHMQMQNGHVMNVDFSVQGDILRFSDGSVLMRQQMPPSAVPQQPGVWGQSQPVQAASPLEGSWAAQTQNGMFVFEFRGSQYRALINGMQIEAGMFRLNGSQLHFQVTQGQNTGQQGVNTWQIQNSMLIIVTPNGGAMQFMRQ